jgi:D-tyrosyl-tRNA(Tyr) deacylase
MRALVQRVHSARVQVKDRVVGSIQHGLLVYLGVIDDDNENDLLYLCQKVLKLRIFEDDSGKMNKSVQDIRGEILVVSQFTLAGDCRKGNRPSFEKASDKERALHFYKKSIHLLSETGIKVSSGEFGAMMEVISFGDGPVNLFLDSKRLF